VLLFGYLYLSAVQRYGGVSSPGITAEESGAAAPAVQTGPIAPPGEPSLTEQQEGGPSVDEQQPDATPESALPVVREQEPAPESPALTTEEVEVKVETSETDLSGAGEAGPPGSPADEPSTPAQTPASADESVAEEAALPAAPMSTPSPGESRAVTTTAPVSGLEAGDTDASVEAAPPPQPTGGDRAPVSSVGDEGEETQEITKAEAEAFAQAVMGEAEVEAAPSKADADEGERATGEPDEAAVPARAATEDQRQTMPDEQPGAAEQGVEQGADLAAPLEPAQAEPQPASGPSEQAQAAPLPAPVGAPTSAPGVVPPTPTDYATMRRQAWEEARRRWERAQPRPPAAPTRQPYYYGYPPYYPRAVTPPANAEGVEPPQ
jgi:hypothetical protein